MDSDAERWTAHGDREPRTGGAAGTLNCIRIWDAARQPQIRNPTIRLVTKTDEKPETCRSLGTSGIKWPPEA